jgi:hypothetical protein
MLVMLDFAVRRLVDSVGVLGRGLGVPPVGWAVIVILLLAAGARPSNLRSASAVAAASPTFMDCERDLERVESERVIPTEEVDGLVACELTDAGGVREVRGRLARLFPDDDPRRNWLIDALDGLGGR